MNRSVKLTLNELIKIILKDGKFDGCDEYGRDYYRLYGQRWRVSYRPKKQVTQVDEYGKEIHL